MKVLLLSRYGRLGSSSRIRSYQYIPQLRKQGIEVTAIPLFSDDYIEDLYARGQRRLSTVFEMYLRRVGALMQSRRFDLIWIEKEILPWLPAWGESALAALKIPYVVDYDDAVFHNYDNCTRKVVRFLLGRKIADVMRRSALVIVGNEYLAEYALESGARRVAQLPSVIDLARYPRLPSPGKPDTEVFTIGWIGTPMTAKYLYLVRDSLAEVCASGKAQVVVVGANAPDLRGVPVLSRPWSEETEVVQIRAFDVGIMPLPDGPWERGKCGYKLIQYMACERPVVASPVGVNVKIIAEGVNGFLANSSDDWTSALKLLRDRRDIVRSLGKAGREKVEREYCVQVTAPRLAALLHSASVS